MARKYLEWRHVSIIRDGKARWGRYALNGQTLAVAYGPEMRTTQIGDLPVEAFAKQLLSDLVAIHLQQHLSAANL